MRLPHYWKTLLLFIPSCLLFAVVFQYDYHRRYFGAVENASLSEAYQAPKMRTVLLWVKLYGEEPDVFAKCPELHCEVSYDRADLAEADAVVFPEVSTCL